MYVYMADSELRNLKMLTAAAAVIVALVLIVRFGIVRVGVPEMLESIRESNS